MTRLLVRDDVSKTRKEAEAVDYSKPRLMCAFCESGVSEILTRAGVSKGKTGVWGFEFAVLYKTFEGYAACGCCVSELSLRLCNRAEPVLVTSKGHNNFKRAVNLEFKNPNGDQRLYSLFGDHALSAKADFGLTTPGLGVLSGNKRTVTTVALGGRD